MAQSELRTDARSGNPKKKSPRKPGKGKKTGDGVGQVVTKKYHCYWPSTVALSNICCYKRKKHWPSSQETTYELWSQSTSMMEFHRASEYYLVGYFEETKLASIHEKCVTIMPKGMILLTKLRALLNLHENGNFSTHQRHVKLKLPYWRHVPMLIRSWAGVVVTMMVVVVVGGGGHPNLNVIE